ncbi:unnamed protein product, partial [Closterium sp. NIES-64]
MLIFLPLFFTPLPTARCHGPRPPPNPPFSLEPPKKKKKGKKEGEEEEGQGKPGSPCPPCVVPVVRECRGRHEGQECEGRRARHVWSGGARMQRETPGAGVRGKSPLGRESGEADEAEERQGKPGSPCPACVVPVVRECQGRHQGQECEVRPLGLCGVGAWKEGGMEGRNVRPLGVRPLGVRVCQFGTRGSRVDEEGQGKPGTCCPRCVVPVVRECGGRHQGQECEGPSMRASLPGAVPSGQLPAVQKPFEETVLLWYHDPCDRVRPMGRCHGGGESQDGFLHGALPQ